MHRALVLCAVLVLSIGSPRAALAFGKKRVSDDAVPAAILSGDATGLVEGCGAQPIVGFTYCRVVEGDAADQTISFIGPPAQCSDPKACVYIKVFNQAGQIAWGDGIPKGKTRIYVAWRDLLGCAPAPAPCSFEKGHRGTWTFNHEVHSLDQAGHDRVEISQGDIVLRVYSKGYTPLNLVEHDPNFVWEWQDGGFIYRMTAGLRAYVGKAP
jgi:hypothetical protein